MDPTLYKAAMEGKVHVLLENLDQLGFQLTPNGNTVLHIAALFGKYECVDVILRNVPSLLCRVNVKGKTALHIAAREGHSAVVRVLVECAKALAHHEERLEGDHCMDILRLTSNDGDTALHVALRYHHLDIVKLLVEQDTGGFSHLPNKAQETPLYLAANNGHDDCVSDILRTCTSPSYCGPGGQNALHAAVIFNSEVSTTKLLQWKPILSEERDLTGWTPLHSAAHLGHLQRVSQLLNVNKLLAYAKTDDDMNTALQLAASRGYVNVMKDLLFHSPDCSEIVNGRGRNILHTAAENNEKEVIKYIFETPFLSYLINQEDNDGNTPLDLLGSSLDVYLPNPVMHPIGEAMDFSNENCMPIIVENSDKCENDLINVTMGKSKGASTGKWPYSEIGKPGGEISIKMTDTASMELQNSLIENKAKIMSTYGDGRRFARVSIKGRVHSKEYIDGARKMADTNLIVAALVATIAFTAGITMPGGYTQDENSPNQGTAVLTRMAAFKAFIISDAIALVFSTSAIFIYTGIDIEEEEGMLLRLIDGARLVVLFSIEAMMVAFVTGTYVVLGNSSALAIATCTIGCSSFLIHCIIFVHAAILSHRREACRRKHSA